MQLACRHVGVRGSLNVSWTRRPTWLALVRWIRVVCTTFKLLTWKRRVCACAWQARSRNSPRGLGQQRFWIPTELLVVLTCIPERHPRRKRCSRGNPSCQGYSSYTLVYFRAPCFPIRGDQSVANEEIENYPTRCNFSWKYDPRIDLRYRERATRANSLRTNPFSTLETI